MEVYLLEIHQSRAFSNEVIQIFKQSGQDGQDYNGANVYFEGAMGGLEEIKRLVGDAPRTGVIEDIFAALEANLASIFEKFDGKVDDRIKEAVNQTVEAAMSERAPPPTPIRQSKSMI